MESCKLLHSYKIKLNDKKQSLKIKSRMNQMNLVVPQVFGMTHREELFQVTLKRSISTEYL